jgi:flagellar motor component MotA
MITKALGLLLLCGSLALVYFFESSSGLTGGFRVFHWPAIVLTGIGPLGIVLLCSDFDKIKELASMVRSHSPSAWDKLNERDARQMHQLTRQFYSSGARALDKADRQQASVTLLRVIERLSLRIPVQDIQILVNKEKSRWESQLDRALRITALGLRMAPSIGMLGTILGMVQLLSHLKDPSNIGTYMSLALLTTFYGLFFSLVFWTPLQNRLESLGDSRSRNFDHIHDWLQLLESRKPIQYFEDSLIDHGISVDLPVMAAAKK